MRLAAALLPLLASKCRGVASEDYSCASLTSCSGCVTKGDLLNYECNWCNKDSSCHAIGSLESKCALSNDCVSLSKLSTCNAGSVESCPASDAVPAGVHVALAGQDGAGNPTGLSVTWFTARGTEQSVVRYGLAGGELGSSAVGARPAEQYLPEYGWHHSVEIAGLAPGADYDYQVGDGGAAWGRRLTARFPDNAAKGSVELVVFGDMGYMNSTVRPMTIAVKDLVKEWSATYSYDLMLDMVAQRAVDGVWHLGDVGYIDDSFAHALVGFTYEESYNKYMDWLEPIASRVPYHVTPGNHESECHSPTCYVPGEPWGKPLSNFTAFNARWQMPSGSSGARDTNMWYSWNQGPVHFVSLNTETDWSGAPEEFKGDSGRFAAGAFGVEGEYLAWLEADLAAADAQRRAGGARPWIVAGGHRPLGEILATHGDLMRRYGVDAYLAGHVHSYTRETHEWSDDGSNSSSNGSILCVVAGGPGNDEQAQAPKPAVGGVGLASFHTTRYAIGVLQADADTLRWRALDSVDGDVLDEVVLNATRSWTPQV